jgi:hypothetical protein
MLHVARRFWRGGPSAAPDTATTESSCSLIALEREPLGTRRQGDVPGFEIPARYFHFVRTGDARPLQVVFEHNRLDLLSLAALTAGAASGQDGAGAGRRPRRRWRLDGSTPAPGSMDPLDDLRARGRSLPTHAQLGVLRTLCVLRDLRQRSARSR